MGWDDGEMWSSLEVKGIKCKCFLEEVCKNSKSGRTYAGWETFESHKDQLENICIEDYSSNAGKSMTLEGIDHGFTVILHGLGGLSYEEEICIHWNIKGSSCFKKKMFLISIVNILLSICACKGMVGTLGQGPALG